jgi:hypothetical protein
MLLLLPAPNEPVPAVGTNGVLVLLLLLPMPPGEDMGELKLLDGCDELTPGLPKPELPGLLKPVLPGCMPAEPELYGLAPVLTPGEV